VVLGTLGLMLKTNGHEGLSPMQEWLRQAENELKVCSALGVVEMGSAWAPGLMAGGVG